MRNVAALLGCSLFGTSDASRISIETRLFWRSQARDRESTMCCIGLTKSSVAFLFFLAARDGSLEMLMRPCRFDDRSIVLFPTSSHFHGLFAQHVARHWFDLR